ncbi:MAG: hypothetical protein KIS29_09525 [Thermoplasmata archaeon]|nr:hypothetical protein [Candidatus Sysuiplasma jiujiangense]
MYNRSADRSSGGCAGTAGGITGNAHVDDHVQNKRPGMLLLDNLKNGV